MKLGNGFQRFFERVKSIWNSTDESFLQRVITFWKTGKIQKISRITYDVTWNIILYFLIIGLIGIFFVGGIGAGYFASLVKDEPIRTYAEMEEDIYNYSETSKLFFSDNVYLGDVRADLHREETTLDKISPQLIQAVIATEDEYFKEHQGIVPKAILRAIFQEITNSSMQSGGSTLTQQLIKNQILTNEVSFERKAKEILLALRLERFFDKDEILEAYLNIIPYGRDAAGRNIAGVQTAAQGIFGIDADEVNLAQAAYLAGLPQSPSYYTPFTPYGELKDEEGIQPGIDRMKTVLARMLELEYITKEEYDEAIEYDIVSDFTEAKESPIDSYPYLTFELEERAKEILRVVLAKEDGYSEKDLENDEDLYEEYDILAERALRNNGYEIHSTIDKEIYDKFQEVARNYEYYGPDRTIVVTDEETGEKVEKPNPVQVGAELIENATGRIIAFVGGRGANEEEYYNHATQAKRPIGSTIKPLIDYAPAMELGVVQPGTPILDTNESFQYPGMPKPWNPGNYSGAHYGIVSAREALAKSHNVPAAKVYMQIINENPAKNYLEKMGITTLTEEDYYIPSLSLGAVTEGITIEENTNAFATFANGGKFVDAYMIEKITTKDGEVVYEHKPEPVEVFSPQTAYLTIDMLRDVLRYGTATYIPTQLKYRNVDWAGKTGTSQDWKDALFVGFNPNVSIGVWMGYDTPASLHTPGALTYSQRVNRLWAELVNAATDINPELMAPAERFQMPEGIVSRSYCAISGMLPSDLCAEAGLVKTDLFNAKFVPTKKDDSLVRGSLVMVDGKAVLAGPNTPKEFVEGDGLMFNPEFLKRMGYDKLGDLSKLIPRGEREKWEKIAFPRGDYSSSTGVKDDGKAPNSPTSVNVSGNQITWKKPGNKDIVGYRIYGAADADGKFAKIGSTTDQSYQISGKYNAFYVTAVDYFGMESGPSKIVTVKSAKQQNDTAEKDKEKETKKKPQKQNGDKKQKQNDQKQNGSEGNNENEETPDEQGEDEENGT